MNINISGRHIETGAALQTHVETRLTEAVSKYFERSADINVTFSKQGHAFEAACAVHLDSGLYLHASGQDTDVYQSFDQSVQKIEKQLRRYKRRLKNHHDQKHAMVAPPVAAEKVFAPEAEAEEAQAEFTPVIIAENDRVIPTLSVSEAVMQLEVGQSDFVLFRSVAQEKLSLVYRRPDANIGWLEVDEV